VSELAFHLIIHVRRCDVTVSEAGVVETSHVAAAVLMIQLAVVLHTNRHVMFFSYTAFQITKKVKGRPTSIRPQEP